MLGKFYKLKAKVSLFLSSKIEEGLDGDVIKKALEYLELAEEELVNDGCLWELREVYYMQARAHHMVGDFYTRDFFADKFSGVNKEINSNSKNTFKKEAGISLDMIIE